MTLTPFTLADIVRSFDTGTYQRGTGYAQNGKVRSVRQRDGHIEAEVTGSARANYRQHITPIVQRQGVQFDGDCSCPMQYNCKHVVAALLTFLRQAPAKAAPLAGMSYPLASWLNRIDSAAAQGATSTEATPRTGARIIFTLIPAKDGIGMQLFLCQARRDAQDAIVTASVPSSTYPLLAYPPAYVTPRDQYLVRLFTSLSASLAGSAHVAPSGQAAVHLFTLLIEEQRLFRADSKADLKTGKVTQLVSAPARDGALGWRSIGEGHDAVRLGWQFDDADPIEHVLPTEPAMYLNGSAFGTLNLQGGARVIPIETLTHLVRNAPQLERADQEQLAHHLSGQPNGLLPLPPTLQQTVREDIAARPCLLLGSVDQHDAYSGSTLQHDFAIVSFDYDGMRASFDPGHQLARVTRAGKELIVRNKRAERRAAKDLEQFGFVRAGEAPLNVIAGAYQLAMQAAWLRVGSEVLPALRERGWLVELAPSFRFDLADIEQWYAEVDDGEEAGNAWFDLELGIVVNGQRIALLPLLLQLIRNAPQEFNPVTLAGHDDAEHLIARLPDGSNVALPWSRIKPILSTLGELYFVERIGDAIRLPTLDAARLAELEAGAQLRWMGGERLRAIGKKLSQFDGIEPVAAPLGLQATLRAYQSEGLAWMQFLREFNLAGILADDMGLGKTIQTLAHILLEKQAGRLDTPALVIAPTSLMGNWQAEAARFAPGLRVLLLQGADRHSRFDDIAMHDLVLTSYALISRDEAVLRQQRFHLVILDESQYIKNSRSKAAHTVGLLQATHRLCLTGTPVQNHLGELWSQFHFLLPGLLDTEKQFNAEFRKPIEKQGDEARSRFLTRRVKPFMLRRTKDAVAKELPPKTEMVREVDIGGAQRDLYETVRLAMDKKVRAEIEKKGVARSQIVILEALLKLRQVCCDPRLVRVSPGRHSTAPSAKLSELLAMLDELLAEGRKILVFSQFTSMLALIEAELKERAVGYALLTGETRERDAQVALFQSGAVPVFLISLKAGGVGLNLTAADTVIHYDPWWNPAAENQATDRAWRIGQDKPVFVYKLIARGTVEEKIQQLQRKKALLADAVLAGGQADGMSITQDDLQAILGPI